MGIVVRGLLLVTMALIGVLNGQRLLRSFSGDTDPCTLSAVKREGTTHSTMSRYLKGHFLPRLQAQNALNFGRKRHLTPLCNRRIGSS